MEPNITTTKKNKDLMYAFTLVLLAWILERYGADLSSVFDPFLALPFMARPYTALLYFFSWLGLQIDPVLSLFALGLPLFCAVSAIYLSVRWGRRVTAEEGKRGFLGFIPSGRRGIAQRLIIVAAILLILLLLHVFWVLNLFEPSIFPELNY